MFCLTCQCRDDGLLFTVWKNRVFLVLGNHVTSSWVRPAVRSERREAAGNCQEDLRFFRAFRLVGFRLRRSPPAAALSSSSPPVALYLDQTRSPANAALCYHTELEPLRLARWVSLALVDAHTSHSRAVFSSERWYQRNSRARAYTQGSKMVFSPGRHERCRFCHCVNCGIRLIITAMAATEFYSDTANFFSCYFSAVTNWTFFQGSLWQEAQNQPANSVRTH